MINHNEMINNLVSRTSEIGEKHRSRHPGCPQIPRFLQPTVQNIKFRLIQHEEKTINSHV